MNYALKDKRWRMSDNLKLYPQWNTRIEMSEK